MLMHKAFLVARMLPLQFYREDCANDKRLKTYALLPATAVCHSKDVIQVYTHYPSIRAKPVIKLDQMCSNSIL